MTAGAPSPRPPRLDARTKETATISPVRRAWLHIGTHRTGTTSLQAYLASERGSNRLERRGYAYPAGQLLKDRHSELTLSTLDLDKRLDMQPFAERLIESVDDELPDVMDRAAWTDLARSSIQEVARDDDCDLVMSDESLSWLSQEDEVQRLVDLFEGWQVSVVCYLRHPHFLRASYQWMASFALERLPKSWSVYYSEPDSWIYDYEYRLDRWRRSLGRDQVLSMSYSACLERDGSIIPSFLELLDVDVPPATEIAEFNLNQSG